MQVNLSYGKACLWLTIVCLACGDEIGLPLLTTILPKTTIVKGSYQEDGNAANDIVSPTPHPTIDNDVVKQEIMHDRNITIIKVICPRVLSSSSSGFTQPHNIAEINESSFVTSLPNITVWNSGTKTNAENISTSSLPKVDLGALEFDKSAEVTVKSETCPGMILDGSVPDWVNKLSITAHGGSIILQEGWAKGADNLKKLWLRISKGIIIHTSSEQGIDEVKIDVTAETEKERKLCSVLPPAIELLDISHTPLEVLHLETPCSSKLIHLEASHCALSKLSLYAPSLVTLHCSGNSLKGNLNWMAYEGGLDSVEFLQANQNSLSTISTCGWPSLRTLDLRRNSVTHLDLSSCPSSNLTNVVVSHNKLVTPPILPPGLLHLDLGHNHLNTLPMITDTVLTANFSNNNLLEIGKSRFKRARKLLHLSLAHNNITHIKEHDLKGLRELRTLDLSHNRLREIAGTSLMSFGHLRKLFLHNNHLHALDVRDLSALSRQTYVTLYHNPWHCLCQLLASLQRLQHCPECLQQVAPVKCRERGSWVEVAPFLRTCLQAVQEVTSRLEDESDEDLSEEEDDLDGKGGSSNKAVVVVPVFLLLIIAGALVATGYRMYHRHKRVIGVRLNSLRNRCKCCAMCGCSPIPVDNGDLNSHRHGELSQIEQDSDTETEL